MKSKFYTVAHFLVAWLVRVVCLVFSKNRKNEPKLAEGPYLVCANHISFLDPVYICAVLRRQQPRFMAKAELFKNPVLAWLLKSLGAYPVERGGADAGVLKKSIRMLDEGYCVGMFPQGTRRQGVDPSTTVVRGGAGLIASNAKATVLPVFIKSKGHRVKFLRPVRVIVGEPIKYEEYTANGEKANDYTYISNYIFERVCALGKDAQK